MKCVKLQSAINVQSKDLITKAQISTCYLYNSKRWSTSYVFNPTGITCIGDYAEILSAFSGDQGKY